MQSYATVLAMNDDEIKIMVSVEEREEISGKKSSGEKEEESIEDNKVVDGMGVKNLQITEKIVSRRETEGTTKELRLAEETRFGGSDTVWEDWRDIKRRRMDEEKSGL